MLQLNLIDQGSFWILNLLDEAYSELADDTIK